MGLHCCSGGCDFGDDAIAAAIVDDRSSTSRDGSGILMGLVLILVGTLFAFVAL
jgi:hypothetical protein